MVGKRAIKNFLPTQTGDVPSTAADMTELEHWVGFRPGTSLQRGVQRFVYWYRQYYGV